MPVVAGIDEVGYGPKLGPLVVCATAFRVPDPSINLWSALAPAVSVRPEPGRIPVTDSKDLFSQSEGIETLEPTALSFLALRPGLPGRSYRALSDRLSLDAGPRPEPWYEGADFELPQAIAPAVLERASAELATAMKAAGAEMVGAWTCRAEPAEFNRAIARGANKSDLLFEQACRLARAVLAAVPGEDAVVRIGKQGGRRMYLPGLVREFGSVWVREETRATSRYEFRERGRRVVVEFLMDAEQRDFAAALASIVGKYLREGAMRLFNAWWTRQAEGVRPTAGYGLDARRFWSEVAPHARRLGIPEDTVFRRR